MVTFLEGLLTIKSFNALITRSYKVRVPMAIKLGRMQIYLDGLLSLKSHDPLIT